jgi:hypothetical protein
MGELDKLKSLNSEFIKRHQSKTASDSSRRCYDDHTITDEDQIFKLVDQSSAELMNRIVCISTILRNLSFVPGNDLEMCKNTLLLKLLGRLIVLKHTHHVKLLNQANDHNKDQTKHLKLSINSEIPDKNRTCSGSGGESTNIDLVDQNETDCEVDSEDLDDEFECFKKMERKQLFYRIKTAQDDDTIKVIFGNFFRTESKQIHK